MDHFPMPGRRPHMPGYGIAQSPTGQLDFAWAEHRLTNSHGYWRATVRPDHRPHVMPVWAVWLDGAVWFSTAVGSRKGRNLLIEPRCSITTEDPREPVVVDGEARAVVDPALLERFLRASNDKYDVAYEIDFLDPARNHTFRVEPDTVIALTEAEFSTSPTRWSRVEH